ncbi:MAG: EF-hand domain-containing protein [Planctomycetaceae bacterium]|nr:EF-hand domain-containing protein [Planctomycetaceae bacterium]
MFEKLDVSGEGRLDLDELTFKTSHRNPERDFRAADANGDGMLSLQEFTAGQGEPDRHRRDFDVFDADHRLSCQEYLSVPSRTSPDQRVCDQDPIVAAAETRIVEVMQVFASADGNENLRLDADEFRNGRVTRDVPGLELIRFDGWDRNSDGSVSGEEVQTVIRAAYGVQRLDGQAYRTPAGTVVNNMLFTHADENGDDRISKRAYLEGGYGGKNAAEKFQEADLDGEGILTFAEWSRAPHRRIDPIAEFLRFDADFSGGLSHEEVMAGTQEWQHLVTQRYLTAFDNEGDQQLSLAEYRRVPMANLLAPWHVKRGDRDGDGHLSFSEFRDDNQVELAGLSREYFDRYDRDDDGKLSQQELDFRVDPNKPHRKSPSPTTTPTGTAS